MKKPFTKKLITLALCGVMGLSFTSLAACGSKNDGKEPVNPVDPNPPIVNPIDPEKPDPKPEQPTWTTEAYDNFVANMNEKQNYRYARTENNSTNYYEVSGDMVRVRDGKDYFLYNENNRTYRLEFSENDFKYHKTDASAFDVNDYIYNSMQAAVLDSFDAETGTYAVTLDGEAYSMTLSDSKISFVNGNVKHVVDKVGSIIYSLPNESNIVDESSKDPVGPGPVDPNPPVVTEDQIFTVNAQGQRVYNYNLLANTVVEALGKKKDGETVSLGEKLILGFNSIQDVKYIGVLEGKIQIGATGTYIDGRNTFDTFQIDESAITNANSKEKLSELLVSGNCITGAAQTLQYSMDMPEYTETVKMAAQNVVDRLATVGVQNRSINQNDTKPVSGLVGAKVLFAYSLKPLDSNSAAFDMGNVRGMNMVIITDNGYVLDALTYTTSSSTITPLERLAEGADRTFLISALTDKKLDKVVGKSNSTTPQVSTSLYALPENGKGKGE